MGTTDKIVETAIEQSASRHDLWVNLITSLKCAALCEIGVWRGEFAETLLSRVDGIESYVLIDPWRNLPDWNKPANKSDIAFENIRKHALHRVEPFADKVVEMRGTTKEMCPMIADRSLDFAYLDGDHTLRGITIDLTMVLPKIREGGFIGGDDFTKTIWQHSDEFSPSEVFPYAIYFAEAHDLTIYTLPRNQFLIVNDNSGFRVCDFGGYAVLTPAEIYSKPPVEEPSF
ncbi:Methyltransferase domain-containing protein [Shimia haliotis]|uniref:Methyltransferase domain-containing protein n=2 Tax=Shimia haliotis TaxID=1280847 RepID=A0A1I4B994_9RHOB|nr:Methyltransferase domain-containing protein [Shimia haliotis]